MGELQQRTALFMGVPMKHALLILLTTQYTTLILVLHYSRVMPPVGGQRYLTSTAVFMNEVFKLAISLTVAFYEISKSAPPSLPATSLFSALTTAVFTGDSWKLAIPAILYTLANSLQYIGLSNLEAATFQVTYQVKIITTAIFSVGLLRRSLSAKQWLSLMLLMVGVAIVQIPTGNPSEQLRGHAHLYFPRSVAELRDIGNAGTAKLRKRSATYEGIEEDLLLSNPHLNASIGLVATLGACIASGFAGVYFEKVLKESTSAISLWVRNVQLAFYSIFPAFFIGVVFLDGENVAKSGFFEGYNWAVWTAISVQALGGISTAFCIKYADNIAKNFATSISIVLSALVSLWFFDFAATGNFLLGTTIVLLATYIYSNNPTSGSRPRPPPIEIHNYDNARDEVHVVSPPKDFSIKLPTTPLMQEALSTSRPSSPHHSRMPSGRSYFNKHSREE